MFQFDPNQYAPNTGAPPSLPVGEYPMHLVSAEWVATKDTVDSPNPIRYIKAEFVVSAGHPLAGRKFYENFNLFSTNQAAVEIAQGNLSALCFSTGVMNPGSICLENMINAQTGVVLKVRPAKGDYPAGSQLSHFVAVAALKPPEGAAPIPTAAPVAGNLATPAAAPVTPPAAATIPTATPPVQAAAPVANTAPPPVAPPVAGAVPPAGAAAPLTAAAPWGAPPAV